MDAYKEEELRLRSLYARVKPVLNSSYSATQDEAISLSQTFECSVSDAWRLIVLYQVASAKLIDLWLREKLTWRALWRIATNDPFSNIRQELEAEKRPKAQREKMKSKKKAYLKL